MDETQLSSLKNSAPPRGSSRSSLLPPAQRSGRNLLCRVQNIYRATNGKLNRSCIDFTTRPFCFFYLKTPALFICCSATGRKAQNTLHIKDIIELSVASKKAKQNCQLHQKRQKSWLHQKRQTNCWLRQKKAKQLLVISKNAKKLICDKVLIACHSSVPAPIMAIPFVIAKSIIFSCPKLPF